MANTAEVINLEATALTGAVLLKWGVSSTAYLESFLAVVEQNGKLVEKIPVSAAERECRVECEGTGYTFNVEAIVAQGGKVVACNPLPVVPPPAPVPPPPAPTKIIIGVNGASGLGANPAALIASGIRSDRLAFAPESTAWEWGQSLAASQAAGFTNQTVIIGNIDDGTPWADVTEATYVSNALKQALLCTGAAMLELSNEPYYKGGVPDPAAYGKLALAAIKAIKAAGVTTPLAVCAHGDVDVNGKWSDAPSAGWAGLMVAAAPELPKLADGVTYHCYGRAGEDDEENAGTRALEDVYAECIRLGFPKAIWVTEMGFQIVAGSSSYNTVPNEAEQAAQIKAVMTDLVKIEGMRGIWPYAIHDEPWTLKPAALAAIASFG
jgi:hypothetical protein